MDLSLADFITQAINDFGTLKGLEGQALAIASISLVIRVILSTMKVSILRQKFWDKVKVEIKGIIPPLFGFLLALLTVKPLTLNAVLLGISSGALAIPLHHLLKEIEALPKINDKIKFIVGLAAKLLGGKIKQ